VHTLETTEGDLGILSVKSSKLPRSLPLHTIAWLGHQPDKLPRHAISAVQQQLLLQQPHLTQNHRVQSQAKQNRVVYMPHTHIYLPGAHACAHALRMAAGSSLGCCWPATCVV
jgi:hypothetical protein